MAGYLDKARAEDYVDYRWLSLMGRRSQAGNRKAYAAYIAQTLTVSDTLLLEGFAASRYAIGDDRFVEEAESDLKEMHFAKVYGEGVTVSGK